MISKRSSGSDLPAQERRNGGRVLFVFFTFSPLLERQVDSLRFTQSTVLSHSSAVAYS